jgi:hypothetical protein
VDLHQLLRGVQRHRRAVWLLPRRVQQTNPPGTSGSSMGFLEAFDTKVNSNLPFGQFVTMVLQQNQNRTYNLVGTNTYLTMTGEELLFTIAPDSRIVSIRNGPTLPQDTPMVAAGAVSPIRPLRRRSSPHGEGWGGKLLSLNRAGGPGGLVVAERHRGPGPIRWSLGEAHGWPEMAKTADRRVAVDRPAVDVGLRDLFRHVL